jgi:hypothetical protein
MKNLTLINNSWKQLIEIQLTDSEKTLLSDLSKDKQEERKLLLERIQEQSLIDANTEDALAAQALYESYKIEGATFIAVDITLPDGSGIINCRINGEHKQIRF